MDEITEQAYDIMEVYKVPQHIADKALFVESHLNTEEGYQAYYEVYKEIIDRCLPDDILWDLSADFDWDDRLNDAFNRLAKEDGRLDLIIEDECN